MRRRMSRESSHLAIQRGPSQPSVRTGEGSDAARAAALSCRRVRRALRRRRAAERAAEAAPWPPPLQAPPAARARVACDTAGRCVRISAQRASFGVETERRVLTQSVKRAALRRQTYVCSARCSSAGSSVASCVAAATKADAPRTASRVSAETPSAAAAYSPRCSAVQALPRASALRSDASSAVTEPASSPASLRKNKGAGLWSDANCDAAAGASAQCAAARTGAAPPAALRWRETAARRRRRRCQRLTRHPLLRQRRRQQRAAPAAAAPSRRRSRCGAAGGAAGRRSLARWRRALRGRQQRRSPLLPLASPLRRNARRTQRRG